MEKNSILEPVLRELSISRSSRQKTYFHWFNYWKKLSSWSWITRFSPILFVPWYYIVFSNFVTAFWQVNFMEGNENTSVLSQHFQSHLDEKKRRNRPSIYASRIYSKTSFKFIVSWRKRRPRCKELWPTYAVHEARKVIRSWTSIRMERGMFVNDFPRLHVPAPLDPYENAQNSETASRSGSRVFTTQMKHLFSKR